MEISESVIEAKVNPIGDIPKNKPEIPAKLKLNATDRTIISAKSNLPSSNRKFMRQ